MYDYMDLLEISLKYDVAVSRAETKRKNLKARLRCDYRQFVKRYRLTKELTRELIYKLTPHMPPVLRSDALDVETKILIALAFYASGSYQTIGDSRNHFISQASVSKAIAEDSGYPLKPTMMTPISEPRPGTPEQYYQGLHLTARNVVERCIGVLKAHFRYSSVDRKLHCTSVTAFTLVTIQFNVYEQIGEINCSVKKYTTIYFYYLSINFKLYCSRWRRPLPVMGLHPQPISNKKLTLLTRLS